MSLIERKAAGHNAEDNIQVIGVWFYEEEEAKKVALLLHQITEKYKAAGLTPTKTFGVCSNPCLPSGSPCSLTIFIKICLFCKGMPWRGSEVLRLQDPQSDYGCAQVAQCAGLRFQMPLGNFH